MEPTCKRQGRSEEYNFGNENAKVRAKTAKADEDVSGEDTVRRHEPFAAESLHLQSKEYSSERPQHKSVKIDDSARTRCEIWTRVMGYHRPVSHFNPGKKSEHYSRKHFKETVAANCEFSKKYANAETC